ncbi:1-phosphofructokinase family hexose kinase [Anditalea andensis]|uniref:Phosphofructokinase n=1 Tax=Anditalea andensis TaxID=1048983 RepID=A0A074L2E0_9BACT|nr:1-phosphofructokinase family hexose kinase [Anditalea andensis]KEO74038.1 phosphofructokinase [Anditalea andensis]
MKIVTLTLNPSLDKHTYTERLLPDKKLRCDEPVYEAGGGGINVSRAIKIMGGESLAIYVAGGPAGEQLEKLLREEGIEQYIIKIEQPTRENLTVIEKSTANQYRFGMPGSEVGEAALKECISVIEELPDEVEFLVASGSLPPGVAEDFYAQLAEIANRKGIKYIVDTSGKALEKTADKGVYLLKPNLGELSQLAGKEEISAIEQEAIAQEIISKGKAEILVVSLGPRGAMLATKDQVEYVVPPTIKQKSTVGAGDSMVAGLVLALSRGENLRDVVQRGVAAGTAATMTAGTELCRNEDVETILEWLNKTDEKGGGIDH